MALQRLEFLLKNVDAKKTSETLTTKFSSTDVSDLLGLQRQLQHFEDVTQHLIQVFAEHKLLDHSSRDGVLEVLDVGCGLAASAIALESHINSQNPLKKDWGIKFTGIETSLLFSTGAKTLYSTFPNVTILQQDMLTFSKLETYDVILMRHPYIGNNKPKYTKDFLEFMSTMHKFIKPTGGELFISVYHQAEVENLGVLMSTLEQQLIINSLLYRENQGPKYILKELESKKTRGQGESTPVLIPESFTMTGRFTPRLEPQKTVTTATSEPASSSDQKSLPLNDAEKAKFQSLMPNLKWQVYPKQNAALAFFNTPEERQSIYDQLNPIVKDIPLIKDVPPLSLAVKKTRDGKLFVIKLENINSLSLQKLLTISDKLKILDDEFAKKNTKKDSEKDSVKASSMTHQY